MKWPQDAQWLKVGKILILILSASYLAIGFFAMPQADDYGMAREVEKHGYWGAHTYWYTQWSGRYIGVDTSNLFIIMTDLSPTWYWIVPWFMLLGTFFSFYFLFYQIGKLYFDRTQLMWASLLFSLILLARLPSISEAYYWLMGATCYTWGNILAITMTALIIKIYKMDHLGKRLWFSFLAALSGAAAVGTNEVLMGVMVLLLGLTTVISIWKKNPHRFEILFIFIAVAVNSAFVYFSPGNAVRGDHFPNRNNFLFSISNSLGYTFGFVKHWVLDALILSSTLLLIPIIQRIAPAVRIPQSWRKPLLFYPMLAAGFIPLTFFPAFWAMGLQPPERTQNLIYLIFLFGWYGTVIIYTLLFHDRAQEKDIIPRHIVRGACAIFIIGLLLLPHGYSTMKDLFTKAPPYRREVMQRIEDARRAKAENQESVIVRPLVNRPTTLYSRNFEFRHDPDHYVNWDWRHYWKLDVILEQH